MRDGRLRWGLWGERWEEGRPGLSRRLAAGLGGRRPLESQPGLRSQASLQFPAPRPPVPIRPAAQGAQGCASNAASSQTRAQNSLAAGTSLQEADRAQLLGAFSRNRTPRAEEPETARVPARSQPPIWYKCLSVRTVTGTTWSKSESNGRSAHPGMKSL